MRTKRTPHSRPRRSGDPRTGQPLPPNTVIARSNWGYHISIKIMLVVLACTLLLASVIGIGVLLVGGEYGLLVTNRGGFRQRIYDQVAWRQLSTQYDFNAAVVELRQINSTTLRSFTRALDDVAPVDLYLRVTDEDSGQELYSNLPDDTAIEWSDTRVISVSYYDATATEDEGDYQADVSWGDLVITTPSSEPTVTRRFEVTLLVPEVKSVGSLYATLSSLADGLHQLRWGVLMVSVLAVIGVVVLFAVCMLVAGRQPDGTVRCNTVDLLPYDLFLSLYVLVGVLQGLLLAELSIGTRFEGLVVALAGCFLLVDLPLLVLLFMSSATRCKCGTILKNTVIFRLIVLIGRGCVWLWRHPICGLWRLLCSLARAIPLLWQGLALMAAVSLSTLAVVLYYDDVILAVIWLIAHTILVPLLLYILMSMRKLQLGAQRLSEGDLGYRIDEVHLFGPLRRHAEYLNDIRLGIGRAVEERLRSERLRTELITNVSHDIKTPLTSIINYIDLLDRECEGESISADARAYIEVVERQSLRLKKLIEDLTEASKASTGAIPVHPAPCQVSVLLSQALAEYQERLDAASLEVVTRLPEQEPTISADGRLLWRVFDNLLSNAAKYSLQGTRLYIDVDTTLSRIDGGNSRPYLRITFRNISGQALNISPDELMERFVRGDASRHTEGSGLGLSIARSLIELHHGSLELEIDGDLFKVVLLLPTA